MENLGRSLLEKPSVSKLKFHVQRVLAHFFNSIDFNNHFNMISTYTKRDFEIIKQELGHDHATSVIVQVWDVKCLVFKASHGNSTESNASV